MQTIFQELRYPIIQAPMAGVQNSRLTLAANQAGILGSLPAAMLSAEQLEKELTILNAQCKDQLYNVNFFAHTPIQPTSQQIEQWQAVLQPYLEEWGIQENDIPPAPERRPFDEAALEIIQRYRPRVISFHFGLPKKRLLDAVKATGAKIIASATTIDEAKWLESQNIDGIIAQGWEAGGHRGWFLNQDPQTQSGTFALLPNLIRIIKLPIIAAGGISNSATFQAALKLGASAVQIGTAFLLADEADTTPAHRQALQSPAAHYTAVSNVFSGGGARGIENRLMRELNKINPLALPFPHASRLSNAIKKAAEQQNNYEFSSFWAGQNAPLCQAGSIENIIQTLTESSTHQ